MMGSHTTRRAVTHVQLIAVDGEGRQRPDTLVTEEPMEIRVAGPGRPPVSVAVTMRTPGSDFELAAGFLFGAGLVTSVSSVRYCDLPAEAEQNYNIVTVASTDHVPQVRERAFAVSASCGLCGTASLDDLADRCPIVPPGPTIARSVLATLPERLRANQHLFNATGGLHAAGLFDGDGELVVVREDVGRHNAVDKVVGHALLADRLPLHAHVLMVSGRVSFEIVEKAAMAGIAAISAVSAPTSLAADAAKRFGVALVGFHRGGRFNIYAHPERIDLSR